MRVGSRCQGTARLVFSRSLSALPLPRPRASPSPRGAFYAPSQFRPDIGSVAVEPERAPDGSVGIWLDHATVAKLRSMRGPDESYSDAILALAEAHAGR